DGKKQPLTPHGFKDATTEETQIRAWAEAFPGGQWGRALEPGQVVLDLDMKGRKNGIREYERLQGGSPEEFDAPRVRTGTGGIHLYTDATGREFKNTANIIAPGVDTKTYGGYVIIPSGNGYYRWETGPGTREPPTPKWAESALRRNSNFESSAEAR